MEKTGLEDFYFFSFLEKEELIRLKEISVKKHFNKDEILFYKGDEAKYLHLLIKGIAKLYTYDHKDNEVVIHNLNEGVFYSKLVCEQNGVQVEIDTRTSDAIAIAGYGAAVVGAPIAGVGAAPGATVAAFGNGLGLLGSGIEIATNLIAGDNGAAGQEAGFVAGGMVIDAVVDRALPGPTPDMSKEATTILKEGVNVKTILTERAIKNSQEEKK